MESTDKNVIYSSADETIATVDDRESIVTGVGLGTTTIAPLRFGFRIRHTCTVRKSS